MAGTEVGRSSALRSPFFEYGVKRAHGLPPERSASARGVEGQLSGAQRESPCRGSTAAPAAHLPVANASRLQATTPTKALDEDSPGLKAKSR